jgi:hypothetical protein
MATPGAMAMSQQLMLQLTPSAQFLANQLNLAGTNSALRMVTMKSWTNNSLLTDEYMYGVFQSAAVENYPL